MRNQRVVYSKYTFHKFTALRGRHFSLLINAKNSNDRFKSEILLSPLLRKSNLFIFVFRYVDNFVIWGIKILASSSICLIQERISENKKKKYGPLLSLSNVNYCVYVCVFAKQELHKSRQLLLTHQYDRMKISI